MVDGLHGEAGQPARGTAAGELVAGLEVATTPARKMVEDALAVGETFQLATPNPVATDQVRILFNAKN